MEPARPSSCAIMSPRRAAPSEALGASERIESQRTEEQL
jgi:hypothetical protein